MTNKFIKLCLCKKFPRKIFTEAYRGKKGRKISTHTSTTCQNIIATFSVVVFLTIMLYAVFIFLCTGVYKLGDFPLRYLCFRFPSLSGFIQELFFLPIISIKINRLKIQQRFQFSYSFLLILW